MPKKVVLAYSGGLDTSVAVKWLQEHYDADVITMTTDLGQGRDIRRVADRALHIGATDAIVVDARQLFVNHCVFPALRAGALYEGAYPLATALARPLIAFLLVQAAHERKASAVAHGCTGKGNDQVRFDLAVQALDPKLEVLAPVREWSMNREEEMRYAESHGVEIDQSATNPYSVDANLWGRSIEGGDLEDPSREPPEAVFQWTVPIEATPNDPEYIDVEFESGIPIGLNGERLDGVELIGRVTEIAGRHGVGRIDHVENRLVGIKSREIYEAPAAVVLHAAHAALESLTLTKDAARFKEHVAREFADLVYNGKYFSGLMWDLMAFLASNQRPVTGVVRVKLHRGTSRVVGRTSSLSLYSKELATYDAGDRFDHSAALGFIKLFGMQELIQARVQMLPGAKSTMQLLPKAED